MSEVKRTVAGVGGHMHCPRGLPPGPKVIWRVYVTLGGMCIGYTLSMEHREREGSTQPIRPQKSWGKGGTGVNSPLEILKMFSKLLREMQEFHAMLLVLANPKRDVSTDLGKI